MGGAVCARRTGSAMAVTGHPIAASAMHGNRRFTVVSRPDRSRPDSPQR
jgi:hypothetical protein